jgi:hypothetical protein
MDVDNPHVTALPIEALRTRRLRIDALDPNDLMAVTQQTCAADDIYVSHARNADSHNCAVSCLPVATGAFMLCVLFAQEKAT